MGIDINEWKVRNVDRGRYSAEKIAKFFNRSINITTCACCNNERKYKDYTEKILVSYTCWYFIRQDRSIINFYIYNLVNVSPALCIKKEYCFFKFNK